VHLIVSRHSGLEHKSAELRGFPKNDLFTLNSGRGVSDIHVEAP